MMMIEILQWMPRCTQAPKFLFILLTTEDTVMNLCFILLEVLRFYRRELSALRRYSSWVVIGTIVRVYS